MYRVGLWPHDLWEGPPPLVLTKRFHTFMRPGLDGAGKLLLGKHPQDFSVLLISYQPSYDMGLFMLNEYTNDIGKLVDIVYDDENFSVVWNTQYFVENVEPVGIQRHLMIASNSFAYAPSGASTVNYVEIQSKWTFTPQPIDISYQLQEQ